jgi:hypothetical protein
LLCLNAAALTVAFQHYLLSAQTTECSGVKAKIPFFMFCAMLLLFLELRGEQLISTVAFLTVLAHQFAQPCPFLLHQSINQSINQSRLAATSPAAAPTLSSPPPPSPMV